jgi:hypothetical protein
MPLPDYLDPPDEASETELTYGELLSNAILNTEVIVTIPPEEEERVKTGIKNFKSRNAKKLKEEGLLADDYTLAFSSVPSQDFPGCIDLSIIAKSKGLLRVKAIRIPDASIPD